MAAPTNISAATATVIASLPADLTQDVHDAGTTYTVWYRYTATVDDTWIGVWGFGDLVTYRPRLYTWLAGGFGTVPTADIGSPANAPIQLAVAAGVTYYFAIDPNSGHPTPAVLTLSVLRGPAYGVPIGSIAINDDSEGFPLVFVDSTTGVVLRAVHPFPAGEAADTLATGVIAVANMADNQIAVYDAALALVGTVSHPAGDLFGFIRAHSSGTFYVGNSVADQVRTLTASGTFGPTTWTVGPGSLQALAANQAETRLYFADHVDHTTKQWNLTTNTTAGLFVAFPTDYYATDILVLADDSILIAYSTISESQTQVVRYDAAATVLNTYTFSGLVGPAGTPSRIASAAEDPEAFWIWTHHSGGLSRFRKMRISDGAELTVVHTTEFETGSHQPPATATPVRFGHSYSCPFWITRVALAGPPAPPDGGDGGGGGTDVPAPPEVAPSYHLDARYIRRLRRAPHVAQENTRVFYRRFELDLERGVGLATGQGSDPMVLLRISRDGGQTWGEEQRMAAGRLGEYTARVIARRLGQARDIVFEVVVSDPVAWSLVGAWLDLESGTS